MIAGCLSNDPSVLSESAATPQKTLASSVIKAPAENAYVIHHRSHHLIPGKAPVKHQQRRNALCLVNCVNDPFQDKGVTKKASSC